MHDEAYNEGNIKTKDHTYMEAKSRGQEMISLWQS